MLFSILIVAFFIFFIFFPRYICFKVPGDCKFYFPYVQCDLHTILTYKKALAQVLSDFLRFLTCFQNHLMYMLRYNRCLFWVWVITYFFVCICNAKKATNVFTKLQKALQKRFLQKMSFSDSVHSQLFTQSSNRWRYSRMVKIRFVEDNL